MRVRALLAQALERWQARGLWVLSRADAAYPRRLKVRLGVMCPPILYGAGALDLFAVDRVLSGADHAAVRTALEAGDRLIVVLTINLERAALEVDYRAALIAQRLLLVTSSDPSLDSDFDTTNELVHALTASDPDPPI